jgi:hypothetical protein
MLNDQSTSGPTVKNKLLKQWASCRGKNRNNISDQTPPKLGEKASEGNDEASRLEQIECFADIIAEYLIKDYYEQ